MADAAKGTSGAISGAAAGATIGSVVPGIGTAIGGVVGGIAGGLAGLFGSSSSQEAENGIIQAAPEQSEIYGHDSYFKNLDVLTDFINRGYNIQDIDAGTNSSRELGSMLNQYAQTGGLPNESDISTSRSLADSLFDSRYTALGQSFRDQSTDMNRLAARLGRSVDDPILQAKLRTGFMDQTASLDAEKNGWATNFALSLPGQRLNYKNQEAQIKSSLATQAMQNRQTLLGLGSNLWNQERNFRLSISPTYGNFQKTTGGGVGDALMGGMVGLGGGMNLASNFAKAFSSNNPATSAGSFSSFVPSSGGGTGIATDAFSGFNASGVA